MPGLQELLVIAVVALLVFGPDRLPDIARNAGRVVARLRAATNSSLTEIRQLTEIDELRRELQAARADLDQVRREVDQPAARRPQAATAGRQGRGPAAQSSGRVQEREVVFSQPTASSSEHAPPFDPDAT